MITGTSFGEQHRVETDGGVGFYRHGWHSWSPTGWVDPRATRFPIEDVGRRLGHDDPVHAFDETMGGSGVGLVEQKDGSVVLLGALSPGAWVRPDDRSLVGLSDDGAVEWFTATGSEVEVFTAYATALAARLGRRGGVRPRVWCSWYSYYEAITEVTVREVLDGLDGLAFNTVQVDDGWQVAVGDWQPNPDFPSGMAALADAIRGTGRRAGLWLAPLIAHSDSRLAVSRPDLLLRDRSGRPVVAGFNWGGPYYALDPTAEATEEYLVDLIQTARGWGYDYLKLDFLYGGAFPGAHRRPRPREQAYRHACEVMRAAAGDDCYLLACGAPILASIGVFDGIRIGPDVAEFWEDDSLADLGDESGRGARNALATSSQRLWLRHAIDVDPDVVFFRTRDVTLSDRARRALRDLARMADFIGVSDPPSWMTSAERVDLERFLRAAQPDVMQLDRYRWRLGGREVDLSWVFDSALTALPVVGRR